MVASSRRICVARSAAQGHQSDQLVASEAAEVVVLGQVLDGLFLESYISVALNFKDA